MSLAPARKKGIIEKFRAHEKDTGSPEVQIGKRRRLLDYLKVKQLDRYREIIKELGIRK